MQTIYLDISNKGVVPTIYAKQGDVGRKFKVVLTDSGLPYIPTGGSVFSVWYSGDSGEGNYTDIGEKSAFTIEKNNVEVELITQMLSRPGDGCLSLSLHSVDGNQIGLWNIHYCVEEVPGVESEEATDHYTAFSKTVGTAVDASHRAEQAAEALENITPESIGALPAIEDTSRPGCYYRTNDGVKEWINPPMEPGVEHRTTERYNGKAVYAAYIIYTSNEEVGNASGFSSLYIPAGLTNAQLVRVEGTVNEKRPFPVMTTSGGMVTIDYLWDSGELSLQFNKASFPEGTSFYFMIYYTKY